MTSTERPVGWKLAVLKRRRAYLAEQLSSVRADGSVHHKITKHDQREHDALEWAIGILDPMVPPHA